MEKEKEDKNWLEWSITIVSTIIVVFTVGFLVYNIITEKKMPPNIVVSLGEVVQKDEGYSVLVKATNKGTETAENIKIEILYQGGQKEEKAEISFAFLPGKSSAKGWIIFNEKPNKGQLQSHVKGYGTP